MDKKEIGNNVKCLLYFYWGVNRCPVRLRTYIDMVMSPNVVNLAYLDLTDDCRILILFVNVELMFEEC